MAIKPVLESEGALYRKLEREAYRAIHAKSPRHKADHFFNFCVTAHAARDFFLECRGIAPGSAQAQPFHKAWNADPLLIATREVANLSKHFQLRDRKTGALTSSRTRHLVKKKSRVYDVLINPQGEILLEPRPASEITLTLSDGTRYDLWRFVVDVLEFWREFLRSHGVRIRRQTLPELLDEPPRRGT